MAQSVTHELQLQLYEACTAGNLAVANRLMKDKRVDPAAQDNSAIRMASHKGHLLIVNQLLKDNRVDPAA
jgi:hypothetical protein